MTLSPAAFVAMCGAVVTILTLVGMLWRLVSAVVRHIEVTKANTQAIATLADALTDNVIPRVVAVEQLAQRHELILSGRQVPSYGT